MKDVVRPLLAGLVAVVLVCLASAAPRRDSRAEQSAEADREVVKLKDEIARLRGELRRWEERAREPKKELSYRTLQDQLRRTQAKLAQARARVAAGKKESELEKTIARLTEEVREWEERGAFPQKEPGYRSARGSLLAARKKLAEVRARATAADKTPRQQPLSDLVGARLEPPSAVLVDQLDLPRGQGLVVRGLVPKSAAARAGLRLHDIVLELAGKAVPSTLEAFDKQVRALKPNTPVDVVLMRKGRKEKVKGLVLPAKEAAP
jgi:hypothetical protein